jgi:hypothetical protein
MLPLLGLGYLATGRQNFSSTAAPGHAANNKRICKVVGTLPAGSRCPADKERRGQARLP